MDGLATWWPILGTLINLGVLWMAWTIRQIAEARLLEATTDIDRRIGGHDTRLTRIEERVEHMPTHDDVAKLGESLGQLRGEVRELGAELRGLREVNTGLSAQVTRIHTWLLETSKRPKP